MSTPFLLIDGYNLLHAAGLAQARYAPGDLNRQRHRLLVKLAELLNAEERLRCTIVFDAKEAPSGLDREWRQAEITIRFAEPGHDADTLIEDLIDDHASPTQLLVVSSDHRLQHAAKHRRADIAGSDEFLAKLIARAKSATMPPQPPAQRAAEQSSVTAGDVAFWMNEFGDIDVTVIAHDDDPDRGTSKDPWQQGIEDLQRQIDQGTDLEDWINRPPRSS